jgi:hypothetical protein
LNGLQHRDEEQNEAHDAHKSASYVRSAYSFLRESFPLFLHGRTCRDGIWESSESDDANDWLASRTSDRRRLAVILEAFENMRISAYTAALLGESRKKVAVGPHPDLLPEGEGTFFNGPPAGGCRSSLAIR